MDHFIFIKTSIDKLNGFMCSGAEPQTKNINKGEILFKKAK
jgi:hypothetical protein